MTCCPNCGHKWTAPKKSKKPTGSYVWTVVEFVDGVIVLRGAYAPIGDYGPATLSAQRMRAASLADGDYSQCARYLSQVPKIKRAWHVDGPDKDKARNTAFAQRMFEPGWGKVLTDPATSWIQRARGY